MDLSTIKPHGVNMSKIIIRDISWLSFNERVLQEAEDKTVPIHERIRFFGIASSNLDEFFRVRVATLKRMVDIGSRANIHLENNPRKILDEINQIVSSQQSRFQKAWVNIEKDLKEKNIFLVRDEELNPEQQKYVLNYFNEIVRSNIVPLMVESIGTFPTLNDESIYLACKLAHSTGKITSRYSLISVPSQLSRFLVLPESAPGQYIILLEDVIRYCLPLVFSYFDYDTFSAHIIKVTRDAEMKEKMAPLHFNQPMVKSAPVTLTFCADYNRFNKWCRQRDAEPGYDNFVSFMTAAIDTLLVAQTVCIAAELKGLGICYLGTVLYTADKIIDLLNLPVGVVPVAVVTLGWPEEKPDQVDRLPLSALVHKEHYHDYSTSDIDEMFAEKEARTDSAQFIKENNKETLAQVFTDVRYKKGDNETVSAMLLELLRKQGFM